MLLCYKDSAHSSYHGWENDALPLGNGKIGAKVFGGKALEVIHFNEKTLWSGGKDVEGFCGGIKNADGGESFRKIGELLEKGDTKKATGMMKELEGDMTGFGSYQSFGSLYIQFDHEGEADNYTRDLDFSSASAMVSYQVEKKGFLRHYFISYPDNVFVGRIKAESEDSFLNFNAYFVSDQKGKSVSEGDSISLEGTVNANVGTDGEPTNDKNNMRYGAFIKIIPEEGSVTAAEDGVLKVRKAKSAVIIVSLSTNYVNSFPKFFSDVDPLKKAKETVLKASEKTFGELYRTHLDDYRALFERVKFTLGEEDAVYASDFMLKRFAKKGEYKRNLITTLFQYGRYLLIASSRDGSLPANLQGIWNAKNQAPWCCDYHFNVNVQMNYWGAYAANLAETALPYIDFVNSLKKPGRIVANKTLGIGENTPDGEPDTEKETGFLFHTMVTPLGFVGPGDSWQWGWAPTNGAWALQGMFDYYLFTGDVEKLKNDIYPAMQECALMWTKLLREDKKGDRLVVSPGYSPEHGPVAAGNTYDQCIIYNLYEDVIKASEVLIENGYENAVSQEVIETVKEQIKRLKVLHIGKWGQIKEWYDEDKFFRRGFYTKSVQPKHRHISHLLSLYPFKQISPDDKKLADAALTTLKDRGNKSTGWGLAVRLLSYARLLQGDSCDEIISQIMKTTILNNFFGTHPPFQIDGNFGLLAGICEMLLQSHLGYIHVLPALPNTWFEGEISGLMARGNFEVALKWKDRKLQKGTVKSNLGGKCALKYDGKVMLIEDENGNEIATEFENGVTSFVAEKGKTYSFS